MAEALMNLDGLKKSVNATLVYTEKTQNALTDLVNISEGLIEHLKVLKRTADAEELKAVEDGWKAPNIEAERYLIVQKGKEVDWDDKRWGNAFFSRLTVCYSPLWPILVIHPPFAFQFTLLTFLFFCFLSFCYWHDVILVSKRVYSWGESPK